MWLVTSFQYSTSYLFQVWLMNPVCLLPIVPISSAYLLAVQIFIKPIRRSLDKDTSSQRTRGLFHNTHPWWKKITMTSCRNVRANMFCLFVSSSLIFLSIFCLFWLTHACALFVSFTVLHVCRSLGLLLVMGHALECSWFINVTPFKKADFPSLNSYLYRLQFWANSPILEFWLTWIWYVHQSLCQQDTVFLISSTVLALKLFLSAYSFNRFLSLKGIVKTIHLGVIDPNFYFLF